MVDENFDRTYQSGRADFNAGIDRAVIRLAKTIGETLDVLHRVQWSAPWLAKSKNTQCG